jgi:membrane-bound lytic murein transglycosylase B
MPTHRPVDHRHLRMHQRTARPRQQVARGTGVALRALLAAGLLAACSGGGRPGAEPAARRAGSPTAAAVTTTTAAASAAARRQPAATTRAGELAAQLTAAERAIRDPATPAAQLPVLGRGQQRAYRAIARQPKLLPKVLPLVPPALRGVVRANATAGIELRELSRPRRRRPLPHWRIVAPAPAEELLADYHAAERRLGVPWRYLAAIHLVETRLGRIRGTSSAGAEGPMQFLPPTWRRYGAGGDVNATDDAVMAAARFLRAHGAPAHMAAALHAYNRSGRYVRAVTAYAEQLRTDQRAFLGYYHWQVFFGDVLLPEGYPERPASRG